MPWVFLTISTFLMSGIRICLLAGEKPAEDDVGSWGTHSDQTPWQWLGNLTSAVSEEESVWSCAQLSRSWDEMASTGLAVHTLMGKEEDEKRWIRVTDWYASKDVITLIPTMTFPRPLLLFPTTPSFPSKCLCYAAQLSFTSLTGIFGLTVTLFLYWTI